MDIVFAQVAVLKALRMLCTSCTSGVEKPDDSEQPTAEMVRSTHYTHTHACTHARTHTHTHTHTHFPIQVVDALLGQCKKQDMAYKTVAIETTGIVLESLKVDRFSDFYNILSPIINKVWDTKVTWEVSVVTIYLICQDKKPDQDEEETAEERRTRSVAKMDLQTKAFVAVGQAWPTLVTTQSELNTHTCNTEGDIAFQLVEFAAYFLLIVDTQQKSTTTSHE